MYTISKEMITETAHRLPSHPGLCSHIHGHSYKWEVTLSSNKVDNHGMVIDFSNLKEVMGLIIGEFDHSLVLDEEDPLAKCKELCVGRVILMSGEPTAENMAKFVYNRLKIVAHREGVHLLTVSVWETATSRADYHGEEIIC